MEIQQDIQPQKQEPQAWPKVAIIVLNWNGWRDTIECLESLNDVDYPDLDVLVVDNGSKDESVVRISEWGRAHVSVFVEITYNQGSTPALLAQHSIRRRKGISRLLLLKLPHNVGFCVGNNIGMQWAFINGAEFLLVLNNDTIVTPGFLKPLVRTAMSDPNIGLVGDVICYWEDPQRIWFAGGKFNSFLETKIVLYNHHVNNIQRKSELETDCVTGCMLLIPRRVYEQLGGFREDFFFWSEDWDYSLRVKKAGYRLVIVTNSRILHKVSRSGGVMQPLSYYYGTRSRLLLKRLHLHWPRRMVFLAWFFVTRLARYAQFAIQGRWDLIHAGCCAIRDYFLGRTGKWSRHVD